jgi:divalent metal cation (Fe/Co/Zn/Cd) transporter
VSAVDGMNVVLRCFVPLAVNDRGYVERRQTMIIRHGPPIVGRRREVPALQQSGGCADTCLACTEPVREVGWLRAAAWAKTLAWLSLVWMCAEGAVGLWQGFAVGSIALIGWALGSAVEGLASAIVVWRFTGARTLSQTAERRAQKAVAVSFWLLAPYIAVESVRDLIGGHRAEATVVGMVLASSSLLVMPALGYAKQRLGARLSSAATVGEGVQNYLCAAQAGAVLTGLGITAAWPGGWWVDPVIGLGIAAWSVGEGIQSWRGEGCC